MIFPKRNLHISIILRFIVYIIYVGLVPFISKYEGLQTTEGQILHKTHLYLFSYQYRVSNSNIIKLNFCENDENKIYVKQK